MQIFFFSIPAHGHTHPMLAVAKELADRGHIVRFYSFASFQEPIEKSKAQFVSLDSCLDTLSAKQTRKLQSVSSTEMTLQDIQMTLKMDAFLEKEYQTYHPDRVFCDSVCFWGKLFAWKYQVPLVISTSTFAFNQLSSSYMKNSPRELADMVFGLPKISKALKTMEPYGYRVKSAMSLVQSDNQTDTVVYTSKSFQPFAQSFSNRYAFVGPSLSIAGRPDKKKSRPLVYISMGTVLKAPKEFYTNCLRALKDQNVDVILSCPNKELKEELQKEWDYAQIETYCDQIAVLARADAFLTHCGMNSVSESLYMETPMVLYPQTGEQHAVAQRTFEKGAGVVLEDDSVSKIQKALMEILHNPKYSRAAKGISEDFRSCLQAKGAADWILQASHADTSPDPMKTLETSRKHFLIYYWITIYCWITALVIMASFGLALGWGYVWVLGVMAGTLSYPISAWYTKNRCRALFENRKSS